MIRLLFIIVPALLLSMPAQATVLEFRENGETVRHESADYLARRRVAGLHPYAKEFYHLYVVAASMKHHVAEDLLHAVIQAESSYQTTAISAVGAEGLMQLMPDTAKRFNVKDSLNPVDNINGGTAYLAWLLERYQGDEALAIAAYNAGEDAVDRYHAIPPYPETQAYVRTVERYLRRPLHKSEHNLLSGNVL